MASQQAPLPPPPRLSSLKARGSSSTPESDDMDDSSGSGGAAQISTDVIAPLGLEIYPEHLPCQISNGLLLRMEKLRRLLQESSLSDSTRGNIKDKNLKQRL